MIAQHGPLGADRLAFLMDADEDVVSPRLSELVALGVLKKGARTAITKRGNRAHVYQLSGKEEEAA
jgi:predicted transcriptional regulator